MTPAALQATSDFYSTNPFTRVMRTGLGALERVWPSLTVRAAYRLFGTPLPPRWLRKQRPWPEGWRSERWAFEDASITVHSLPSAPLVPSTPQGPVVLLVHGWGGHAQQMLPLAQALAAQGMQPVLIDLPAHGVSRGRVSNLPQFARAIEYTAARLAQQGHVLRGAAAHSLAANALAFAASRGLRIERLVLLAPPASPYEYTRLFAHAFGLSEATRAGLQRRVESREGVLMSQFEPQCTGPNVAAPTLVVHDREDRVNHFADGEAFAREIKGARLTATQGLGHSRMLRDEQVTSAVAAFIAGAD
ncbi:alpha/beta fold hydrolase [Variovorax sp. VNK109]|uniref:alpha/beta fold hydrolase n=1 Tax=Variovorax sp. VNK109 TaxID=3400919 RepID=UPI003C0D2197